VIPTIVELFGEPVSSYFSLLLVGFALATLLAARRARATGYDREVMIDLGLYSLIWGVLGGRVLHVLADGQLSNYVYSCLDPSKVAWHIPQDQCAAAEGLWDAAAGVCRATERNCFAVFAFWQGGLAYYGGLIAALAFGLHFLRKENFPVGKGADFVACGVALGLFFGRMGCFFGGCCFGSPTDSSFGMSFPAGSPASEAQWRLGQLDSIHHASLPVHPTQLYEAISCLVLAAILYFVVEPRKRFDGQVMLVFLAGYSAIRFAIEFLRADDRGGVAGISTSQWISVAATALVVAVWPLVRRRAMASSAV